MTRVLVVGAGMVGARVADDLLAADSAGRLDQTPAPWDTSTSAASSDPLRPW